MIITCVCQFSAGADQVIKVWNMEGARLSTIRPTTGFLNQKTASTRALTFHPNLMVMAASGNDGYITVGSFKLIFTDIHQLYLAIQCSHITCQYVKYNTNYYFILLNKNVASLPFNSTKDGWWSIGVWFIFTSFCFNAFHNILESCFFQIISLR